MSAPIVEDVHDDPAHRAWHREVPAESQRGRMVWVCLDCAHVRGRV